jgi:hypothetical protein
VGRWLLAVCLMLPARSIFAQSSAAFPDVSTPPSGSPSPPPAQPAQPAQAPTQPSWDAPASAVPEQPTQPPNSWSNPATAVPDAAPGAVPTPAVDLELRPPLLPYREGMPVPPGYVVQTRANSGLIAGGLVGLGITYVAGLVVASGEDFGNGTSWALVPVIGPWGAIGARKYSCKASDIPAAKKCVQAAVGEVRSVTFLAVDGIGQMASAVVFLAGLLSSSDELLREDLLKQEDRLDVTDVTVEAPSARGEPWSLSVRGNF